MPDGCATAPKFALGQTVITANAKAVLPELDVVLALQRHHSGDWGDVDDHDRQMNDDALRTGERPKRRRKRWLLLQSNCDQMFLHG